MTSSPSNPAGASPAGAVGSNRAGAALRLAIAAAFVVAAVVLGFVVRLPPIPTCAFKLWTGMPCPGCGMTRSVVRLVHGDLGASLRFHPLGLFVGAFVAATGYGAARSLATGRDPVWEWFERRGSPLALGFVGAMLALWVVRTFVVPDWAPDPIGAPTFLPPWR